MVTPNRFELEQWGQRAARAYLDTGVPLNETIVKIASSQKLNENHIERVVQAANSFTNGLVVGEKRASKEDPRVSFEMAETDSVMRSINGSSPASHRRKVAQDSVLDQLFRPPDRTSKVASCSNGVDDFPMEMARDPFEGMRRPVETARPLSHGFIFDKDAAVETAKIADYATLSAAVDDIDMFVRHARTKAAFLIDSADFGMKSLTDEVDKQLLNNEHPETIKAWSKHAGLSDDTVRGIEVVVDDRFEKLCLTKFASPDVPEVFIANPDHPLKAAAEHLEKVAEARSIAAKIVDRAEDALLTAKKSLKESVSK